MLRSVLSEAPRGRALGRELAAPLEETACESEIRAVIEELSDHDCSSFDRLEPLARPLAREVFFDVVARTRQRIKTGRIRNQTGLLRSMLHWRIANGRRERLWPHLHKRRRQRTLREPDGASYARGGHAWPVAAELLSRKTRGSSDGSGRESRLRRVVDGLAHGREGVVAGGDVVDRDAAGERERPPLDDLAAAPDDRVEAEQSAGTSLEDELHEPERDGVARERVVGTKDVVAGVRGCLDLEAALAGLFLREADGCELGVGEDRCRARASSPSSVLPPNMSATATWAW